MLSTHQWRPAPSTRVQAQRQRARAAVSVASALLVLAVGCSSAESAGGSARPPSDATSDAATPDSGNTATPTSIPMPGSAKSALLELPVKGRAPKTSYTREQFGSGWTDVDKNGCDTRDDILRRDLADITAVQEDGCIVSAGTLIDPYSGQTVVFQRGSETSNDVQIDHVVSLSDAWQKGAQGITTDQRVSFANDPLNLLAVRGDLNQQKGTGDAATWLPPDRSYRCAYVARQIAVKKRYQLWVSQAETDAMARILSGCPNQPLPE